MISGDGIQHSLPAIDTSGAVPEARPIVEAVTAIYLRHTAPWFLGLILHGSAVKGGFVPGCSDLDFQLYLDDSAFTQHGQLPLDLAFAVYRDLAPIDPAPFRYVQCYTRTARLEEGWVGPIPGAYHIVAGRLPIPEATAAILVEAAARALADLDPAPSHVVSRLLGQGGVRLARSLRLLCTQVWPPIYQVLTLQATDPIAVWRLPKGEAITRLPTGTPLRAAAARFYDAVRAYYPAEESLNGAFDLIASGIACLEAAKRWWESEGMRATAI
ncbi:MAG: hypothetical protein PVG11_09570 [Anaerolineae bacterium]|jgi:hypothetical protein